MARLARLGGTRRSTSGKPAGTFHAVQMPHSGAPGATSTLRSYLLGESRQPMVSPLRRLEAARVALRSRDRGAVLARDAVLAEKEAHLRRMLLDVAQRVEEQLQIADRLTR